MENNFSVRNNERVYSASHARYRMPAWLPCLAMLSVAAMPWAAVAGIEEALGKARLVGGYGKLPLSFEPNRGQTYPEVKFLSRGAGYSLFLTSGEAVLSLRKAGADRAIPGKLSMRGAQFGVASLPGLRLPGSLRAANNVEWRRTTLVSQTDWPYSPRLNLGVLLERTVNPNAVDLTLVPFTLRQARDERNKNNLMKLKLFVLSLSKHEWLKSTALTVNPQPWIVDPSPAGSLREATDFPSGAPEPVIPGGRTGQDVQSTPVTATLRVKLLNAKTDPEINGLGELPGKVNYFRGSDPEQWKSGIPTYAKVRYRGLYPGVDLIFYGNPQQLEYDFVVAPGADPGVIRLAIGGADRLDLDAWGNLVLKTRAEDVRLKKPVVYQAIQGQRRPIEGHYVFNDVESPESGASPNSGGSSSIGRQEIGFQIAAYDPSQPLVIDPVLVYSTYLGGSESEQGNGIAVDDPGNAYVTGYTESIDFPTANPAQSSYGGGFNDAFVTKLNAAGSAIVYSTYLGGGVNRTNFADDIGNGIAVDGAGNAYVTGETNSVDFPTTVNAVQGFLGDPNGIFSDAFVAKLDSTGALLYSTYLGVDNADERGKGIAVDSAGNAYVTGEWDFDGFLTKVNATGSALDYPGGIVILSGNGVTRGESIAIDSPGNAYVAGSTTASALPGWDAFVIKLNSASAALVYSRNLGGDHNDFGKGIAVDGAGNAYVTGYTESSDFPTRNPLQSYDGAFDDAFVTKLDATGSALVYSTYLGGERDDRGHGIAVDSAGNAYVIGSTRSRDFFPTVNAVQSIFGGESTFANSFPGIHGDAFLTKLSATGSTLLYSTYLGGSLSDNGFGIALDKAGNAYVTGETFSSDFPAASPLPGSKFGLSSAFIAKIVTVPGAFTDTDGDGVSDAADNCPAKANASQTDKNGDGVGDICSCDVLTATIPGSDGDDILTGTDGNDVIFGLDGNDTIDGGNGDDVICGNNDADTIIGGDGADLLFGNGGADTLKGKAGADQIKGGGGNDIVKGGGGTDTCNGGAGTDTNSGGCEVVTGIP